MEIILARINDINSLKSNFEVIPRQILSTLKCMQRDHRDNNAVFLLRVHASVRLYINHNCDFEEYNAFRWITSEVICVKDMSYMLNCDGFAFLIGYNSK